MESVDFSEADMTNVTLDDTNIGSADFTGADLTGGTGEPEDAAEATWFDTTCPTGVVQSTPCFSD